jgi:CheY-like chemotaxis protein
MLSRASGVRLHDHNCGFKCYRAGVVRELNVYGEMHRMMPSLAGIRGFKSTEIEVEHHPRRFGQSKYGVKRFLRGFMDMMTVWFLRQYRERPLHLMGGLAATALIIGGGLFAGSFAFSGVAGSRFAVLGTCVAAAAIPLMATGFLAELVISRRNQTDRQLPVLEEVPAVELPALVSVADFSAELPVTNASPKPAGDETPLVLVSDDDPNARRLMAYHLENIGFRVVHAKNGPETIEKMGTRPTVVLLDLMLPGLDGLQCLQHIRKVSADTKVIMVSAHGQIRQAVGAMKLGAYDYIAKPFDPAQLVGTVRRAVQQQNLVEEHIAVAA